MKRSVFLFLISCFYIFLFLIFKIILVYNADLYMDNKIYEKKYNIGKTLTVNKKEINNKFEVLNLEFENELDDFYETEKTKNYVRLDNSENKASFIVSKESTIISSINDSDLDSIFRELYYYPMYISETLRNHSLEKHNIKNDVDLIKYIRSRKKKEVNVFTPSMVIKEDYLFNFLEASVYNNIDNITYLENEKIGYILNYDTYKEANIIVDDTIYNIVFVNLNYFDNNKISNILDTLRIK